MASDKDSNDRDNKNRRSGFPFDFLLNGLSGRAGQTLSKAVGQSGNLLDMLLKAPEYMEQIGKAGRYLKDLRQVAGLTLDDLASAVKIENPEILRAIEEGRSPITLDILLRLASFYSRNDPISFAVNFSREYAPWLWQILRIIGIEKFVITLERELKFINIYRSRDAARQLSNEDFDKMLAFVRGSFDLAMDFIEPETRTKTPEKKRQGKSSEERQVGRTGARTSPKTSANARKPPKSAGAKSARPRKAPAKKSAAQKTHAQKSGK